MIYLFNIVRYTGDKVRSEHYFCKYLDNFYDAQTICNFLNSKSGINTKYKVVNSTYKLKSC